VHWLPVAPSLTILVNMLPKAPDILARRPARALLAVAGALLLLATTLALPLLHEAFHGPGESRGDCPVYQLQIGFSLVLTGPLALLVLHTCSPASTPLRAGLAPRLPRRSPAAPRAPPQHSSFS